jgi:peptide/nickel transport system ATP-binding protein
MICDRIMVMKDGIVVEEGKTEDVVIRPSDEYTRKLLDSVIAV